MIADEELQNSGTELPQDMVETSDLPEDVSFHNDYEAMRSRDGAAPNQVMVAALDNGEETAGNTKAVKISCHSCGQKLDMSHMESFSRVACPACGAELIVPRWFDNYLLEETAGIGGMATVYRALDLALDREVAIKVLNDDLALQVDRSEMFLQEARTAATINHYAVIPIYTCGIFENQTYIVMQYMSGGSLEALLENVKEPLPLPHVVSWIRDVAAGLENACQHGIVHHDIKPANIMLDQDGKAKIGDFGIAQIVNSGNAITAEALAWVSPHYVSPEKILYGTEDFRGDIYSLGATFYHLATGKTPHDAENLDELLRLRVNEMPPNPSLLREEIPAALGKLILSMLAIDPAERPGYTEILTTLNRYLANPAQFQKKHTPGGAARRPAGAARPAARTHAPTPPVKKQGGFLIFLLKLFSHLLSLTLLLTLTIFVLDKYDRLNHVIHYLPEFMQERKKPLDAERRLNTMFIQCLQSGDPETVLKEGEETIRRETRGKRIQAALQTAFAAYLINNPEQPAEEFVNAIYVSVKNSTTPYEKIVYEDNLLLLRLLAGDLAFENILAETRFKHAQDFAAKLALADLLYRIRTEKDMLRTTKLSLLDDFEVELEKLRAVPSWLFAAFADRLPYWRQVMTDEKGIIDEIEPLFRPFIKEEAKWTFREPKKLRKKSDHIGIVKADEESEEEEGSEIIISPMRVKDSYVRFKDLERPQPEMPMTFFDSFPRMQRYGSKLSGLSQELIMAETIILNNLRGIKADMIKATTDDGPLEIKSLEWTRKRNRVSFTSGKITFTERNVDFKPESGENELLRWEECGLDQLLELMKAIAVRRCEKPAVSKEEVGTKGVATDKRERAKMWMNIAYVANWYGKLDLVAEAITNALKQSKDQETVRQVEQIFLKEPKED